MNTKKKELIENIILARQFWVCLYPQYWILRKEEKKEKEKKKTVYENHTVIE